MAVRPYHSLRVATDHHSVELVWGCHHIRHGRPPGFRVEPVFHDPCPGKHSRRTKAPKLPPNTKRPEKLILFAQAASHFFSAATTGRASFQSSMLNSPPAETSSSSMAQTTFPLGSRVNE